MPKVEEIRDKLERSLKENLEKGYYYTGSLKDLFSFSEKVIGIGELNIECRGDSYPSLATYLYLKKDSLPEPQRMIYWYTKAKAKKKSLILSYDLDIFEWERDLKGITTSKVARAFCYNTKRSYLELYRNFYPMIEDIEKKDPEPYKQFLRLVAGGITLEEREKEFEKLKALASSINMETLAKGVWLKSFKSIEKMIDLFIKIGKNLGDSITLEMKNLSLKEIPKMGRVVGFKLEDEDERYDLYRIWLNEDRLNTFVKVRSNLYYLALEILSYFQK
ncbi:hypothetical protein HRbin06_00047 [archaeon HR06]|nr:hypothetical protein HRbin06_00047 [archaeon HR06]